MPLRMNFILEPGVHVKDKINCLKEGLKLNVRSEGEEGVLIFRNEDRTARVDLQVVQNEDYTISYNILVSLEKEEYRDIVLACLGEPVEMKISKPTILDICNITVSRDYQSLNELVNDIIIKFNLSEAEVKEYFRRINTLSEKGNMPGSVLKAVKIIKKLS